MKSTIFIPRTLHVGYQIRKGTYSGKLAYVIYTDNTGKVRKSTSWAYWRDSKIEPDDFDNTPTQGFVLNKKAGGTSWGWNPRQTYTRVYDPRGFEFEITIPNLLYILENVNSVKGKGLVGEFVYGWSGSELILVPVDAPDYKEMQAYASTLYDGKTYKGKDLVLGATYKTKQQESVVYLGRFDYFERGMRPKQGNSARPKKRVPKRYFFEYVDRAKGYCLVTGLKAKIIDVVDKAPVHDFADRITSLENNSIYSPFAPEKYKYVKMNEDELTDADKYYDDIYLLYNGELLPVTYNAVRRSLASRFEYDTSADNSMPYYDETGHRKIAAALHTCGYNTYNTYNTWTYSNSVDILKVHKRCPLYKVTKILENGNIPGGKQHDG